MLILVDLQDWYKKLDVDSGILQKHRSELIRRANTTGATPGPVTLSDGKSRQETISDTQTNSHTSGSSLKRQELVRRGRRTRKVETREELLIRLLDPTLTLEETARMLEVCPTTVRRYTNKGILPHERSQGNQRRFKLSSVLAFLELQGRIDVKPGKE
jgi:excisionase family DNA binding protein